MRSEKYIGVLDQCGIRIENGCPALIDKETFYKVQARLDENAKHGARNKRSLISFNRQLLWLCGSTCKVYQEQVEMGVSGVITSVQRGRKQSGCKKKHEKRIFLNGISSSKPLNMF